jgi:hypothetical protein
MLHHSGKVESEFWGAINLCTNQGHGGRVALESCNKCQNEKQR